MVEKCTRGRVNCASQNLKKLKQEHNLFWFGQSSYLLKYPTPRWIFTKSFYGLNFNPQDLLVLLQPLVFNGLTRNLIELQRLSSNAPTYTL